MASLNKALLIGNLGRDPETRYTPDGAAITSISVATTETWKDKQSGEKQEKTAWHRVVFFGKLAEIAGEYLKKGSSVYVEGRIDYQEYEKDGVKKYSTQIIANSMQMLGARGEAKPETPKGEKPRSSRPNSGPPDDFDPDSIPF